MRTVATPKFQEFGIKCCPTFNKQNIRRIGRTGSHSWFDAVEADGSRRAEACTAFRKGKSFTAVVAGLMGSSARSVRRKKEIGREDLLRLSFSPVANDSQTRDVSDIICLP